MASHYVEQIRRVRPNGPYSIVGSCTGGLIAYEMAQQLVTDGEDVALVVMDTWHPSTYHPHRYRLPMRSGLPLFLLWRAIRTIPSLVRVPIKDWIPFLQQKWKRLVSVSKAESNHDELLTEFQVERVTRATLQAVARYDVRKYPGRMLNIVASNRYVARSVRDTRQVWPELGGEGSKTVKVAAINAGDLLAFPHVEEVRQHLLAFFPKDSQHQPIPVTQAVR
ncbi:MAG: thioesterase domain-containing protein [Nitrospira sp.]